MPADSRLEQRFRPDERLRHAREFQAVFGDRRSVAGDLIVVYGRPNELGYNRLGITVSRKFGAAVARNRFKRRVREAFRRTKDQQPTGWDWIVLPAQRKPAGKKSAAKDRSTPASLATQADIQAELLNLMNRIRRRNPRKNAP